MSSPPRTDDGRNPGSRDSRRAAMAGYTMTEMLCTLSIFTILVAAGSPNGSGLLTPFRVNSAARQVATDLQLVRMKAIAQNRTFRAIFINGGRQYWVERDNGAGGWVPQALHEHGTAASEASIALPWSVTSNAATMTFEPRGSATAAVTVTLNRPGSPKKSYVVVNLAGRVRTQ